MNYFFEQHGDIAISDMETFDFAAHLHNHIELCYMIDGCTDLYIEDKCYRIEKDSFFIIFPNQIHRYENSHNINAKMLIFIRDLIPEYNSVFSEKLPVSPVADKNISGAAELIMLLCREYRTLDITAVKGFITALTGLLFRSMEFHAVDKYSISTLKNVLIYCDAHYTEPITIGSVANELHISRSHISHIFKSKLNTTFGDHITAKRIKHACRLLKNTTATVTETAFASGFDSVRTFNRVFVQQTGTTPKEYRKSTHF